MQMPELDDLDLKILKVIKDNARVSYSEVGKQAGISRVSVKKRMDAMEKRGVILGYTTKLVQPKKTGSVLFFMDIVTTADTFEAVIQKLKGYPMIKKLYITAGEYRLHCVGRAADMMRLELFVRKFRSGTEGIIKMECHHVLSTVKEEKGE